MTEVSGEFPKQVLEDPAFRATKTRIDKSKEIAQRLRPQRGPYDRDLTEEIRLLEMESAERVSGREEILVDTRDYTPYRYKASYTSADGSQTVSEDLVYFGRRREDGQMEWLQTLDGRTVAINSELYDSRLTSGRRAQGMDYNVKTVPRINENGEFVGVFTIIEPK